MSIVGYARVSSFGQNLESQIDKLNNYGCEFVFQEKVSGVDRTRPELKRCLDFIRSGDTLVITKLDRLARSASHLSSMIEGFEENGINFVVLDQNIDTTTPTGKLMFHMLSAFAEFENNIRRERQTDGIQNALKKGTRFGRPRKISDKQVEELVKDKEAGMPIVEIKSKYGLSQPSIYRILSEYQERLKLTPNEE